jgi:hypothetical protein
MVSDTPQTDDLARGNHVVPTEFAQDLERQLRKAREQCHKLRLERMAADRAYADICREMELMGASQ